MIVEYEGKSYPFDMEDVTVKQALKIEKHMGGPLADFQKGVGSGDLAAIQALGWLILAGGDQTPIADMDFKIARFMDAFNAAATAEAAAEAAKAEVDPTVNGHVPASSAQTSGRVSSPTASATYAPAT